MANVKKMTKRDYYNAILAKYALTDAEKAFIEHELELLDRKNASGEKKKGAAQIANDAIREAILAEMEDNRLYTISEMVKELPSCAGMQNQRVSGLIRTMIGDTIERTTDKRKAYFSKIAH